MPVFHDLFDCILTIWLSGCQTHKNSHLDRTARESNEAQLKHEGTGDLRYFASLDQHSHNTFQSYYTCLIDGLSHCTFYTGCFLFLWSTKELSLWHIHCTWFSELQFICVEVLIYMQTHTHIYIYLYVCLFFSFVNILTNCHNFDCDIHCRKWHVWQEVLVWQSVTCFQTLFHCLTKSSALAN